MKKFVGKCISYSKKADHQKTGREQLRAEVKKGSEEAVRRYKGVLERLAEYDRV